MDILWTILLMILLYVVPELFKHRPKTYEYPQVPEPVPLPHTTPAKASLPEPSLVPAMPEMFANKLKSKEGKPMSEVAPPMQALDLQEAGGWRGGLDQAAIINGIILAEILQPPKAKRLRH